MTAATTLEIESWPQTVDDFDRLVETTQDELVQFAFYRLGNQVSSKVGGRRRPFPPFAPPGLIKHLQIWPHAAIMSLDVKPHEWAKAHFFVAAELQRNE